MIMVSWRWILPSLSSDAKCLDLFSVDAKEESSNVARFVFEIKSKDETGEDTRGEEKGILRRT